MKLNEVFDINIQTEDIQNKVINVSKFLFIIFLPINIAKYYILKKKMKDLIILHNSNAIIYK